MNVRWSFAIFAVALTICQIEGFYSHKCKEAETASDKIGRFIENANCTLVEGHQKLKVGLKNIHNTFKLGIDHFRQKFAVAKKATKEPAVTTTTSKYEGLDHNIDVRILSDDDAESTTRPKRDASNEGEGEEQGKHEK